MDRFLIIIVCCFIIISPIYIFESGLPQPAHYILAIGMIAFLIVKELYKTILAHKVVLVLIAFLSIVVIVNSLYLIVFAFNGVGNSFYLPTAQYIFNAIFFIMLLYLMRRDSVVKHANYLASAVIIAISIQTLLALSGINKETQYVVTERIVILFNNPNQLGYFVLLALTLYTVLPSKYRTNRVITLFMCVMSLYLGILSSSRIILFGLILLIGILLYTTEKKVPLKYWLIFIPILVLIGVGLSKTNFIEEKIELIEIRNQRNNINDVNEFQIRGYDRILNHPMKVLYGAGEGNYDRFESFQIGEIHSSFGNLLFSYGIFGFVLFLIFIYTVIKENLLYNFVLLIPIMLYNLVHNGLRASLFWGVLAVLYMQNNTFKEKEEKGTEYS